MLSSQDLPFAAGFAFVAFHSAPPSRNILAVIPWIVLSGKTNLGTYLHVRHPVLTFRDPKRLLVADLMQLGCVSISQIAFTVGIASAEEADS